MGLYDQVSGYAGTAWQGIENGASALEHGLADLGEATARDVAIAGLWTCRNSWYLLSPLSMPSIWTFGQADSRLAGKVPPHHYDTVIPLGRFNRVTPQTLMDAIRHHPKYFPISGSNDFELNSQVTLRFCGTPNPVRVKKLDTSDPNRASMLLETEPGHFFSGTAEHIVLRQESGQLAYEVIGNGPKGGELWDRNRINTLFGLKI